LGKYPNLYGDLSAMSGLNAIERDLPHGIDFLTRYQDKLVFGTDKIPVPFFEWGHIDFYNALTLPDPVTTKIFRENARRIFRIPTFPE
jgi:predicted TIM-barrel fold metal-dependent hydrolase